jgi:hypothetical protein
LLTAFAAFAAFAAKDRPEYYAVLFISLQFPLLAGPNPLSAALFPHRITNPHSITEIFSRTVDCAFIHEDGKL